MGNFVFSEVQEFTQEVVENNFFLVLVNPINIPPHLFLAVDEKVFSISVNGKKVGVPFEALLKKIKTNNTPALFIQINPISFSEKEVREIFENSNIVSAENSCLSPIKAYFSLYFPEAGKSQTVFELIDFLKRENMAGAVFHMNMDTFISGNIVSLKTYSLDIVREKILELQGLAQTAN
jgi:hypothetical protein